MNEKNGLAERFERHRAHLRAIAYRMLGADAEADDAVQETWLRLSRTDAQEIDNLGGWLTTVLSRVCLDMLRARTSAREDPLEPEQLEASLGVVDPERDAQQADAVGAALQVVLDTLAPAERLAFVLHDLFAVSFEDIAGIMGRTSAACRQLASRARRRVQGAPTPADQARQREVVEAFLAASRNGEFDRLLALLDPEAVLRADPFAVKTAASAATGGGAPFLAPEVRGAEAVAKTLSGRARGAQVALVDGEIGCTWAPGGKPRAAFTFTIRDGKVLAIEIFADPATLAETEIAILS